MHLQRYRLLIILGMMFIAVIFFPTLVSATPSSLAAGVQSPAQAAGGYFFWYLSRTSAIAAYILLFINVCLGIGLKTKQLDWLFKRWLSFDLHQTTAILAGMMVLLHIFSLLGDSYAKFTPLELLLPGLSPLKPLWTALGVVAFYGGAAVAFSSFLRKFIGQKTWRIIHYASFVLFFAVLFHGIKTGTDSSTLWMQGLYVGTGACVTFLALWRFLVYQSTAPLRQQTGPLPGRGKNKVPS